MTKFNLLLLTVCFIFVTSTVSSILNPFLSTPIINTKMTFYGTGTVVKIALDQSMVVVGYSNGSVVGFSMSGSYLNQFYGSSYRIIDIEWIPGVGPMALDNTGRVYAWYKNGASVTSPISVGSSASQMAMTVSTGGSIYVAINFGSLIREYLLSGTSYIPGNVYNPPSGSYFTQIMYSSGYNVLFAATSSRLLMFNCFGGSLSSFSFVMPGTSYIQAMAPYNGNYVMLLSNNQVYSFTTFMTTTSLGSISSTSYVMTTCPSGPYIMTGSYNYDTISVYDFLMIQKQVLTYPYNNVISMDCSAGYLVSLDSSNYLAIDTYQGSNDDIQAILSLAGWIIGVIVGVISIVVVGIIICICVCCCRRRSTAAQAQLALNNTMGQELIITSPTPQYNTQYSANTNYQYETNNYNHNMNNQQNGIHFQANFEQKF